MRVIEFDRQTRLFHVRDYYENGQLQMDAFYASFDKTVKEEYQCNYRSNTKEGPYTEWYRNGRPRFTGHFTHGVSSGTGTAFYESGQKEAEENRLNSQLHGRVRYWSEKGDLQFESTFDHGMNQRRRNVSYRDLSHLPKDYEADASKKWPLVIYLHGGSDRGPTPRSCTIRNPRSGGTGDGSSRSSCSPRSAPSTSGGRPMTGSRTSTRK